MKVDTKKMIPIKKVVPTPTMKDSPDHGVYYNDNKFIPDAVSSLHHPENNKPQADDGILGSIVRYLPVIFFTPVKTSARAEPRPGTVDVDEMNDLIKSFKDIAFVGNGREEEKTSEEEEKTSEEEKTQEEEEEDVPAPSTAVKDDKSEREGKNASPNPRLGRYKTLADTHKSEKVEVIRSYRLADSVDSTEEKEQE